MNIIEIGYETRIKKVPSVALSEIFKMQIALYDNHR